MLTASRSFQRWIIISLEYSKLVLDSKIRNYISKKLIFKVNSLERLRGIPNQDYYMFLSSNGDSIYTDSINLERIQTPFVSKTEYLKIIDKINK